jgi:hypothetical protein
MWLKCKQAQIQSAMQRKKKKNYFLPEKNGKKDTPRKWNPKASMSSYTYV